MGGEVSSKTHELTREEQRALDHMAETSDFWSRIRASAAEYDGLTEKQYERFLQQVERDSWMAGAQRVNGVPVRNKFRTGGRKPRCADREKPYCESEATVVVGTYAYCSEHAEAARESLDQWKASRGARKDSAQKGEADSPAPVHSTGNAVARMFDELDGDVPF